MGKIQAYKNVVSAFISSEKGQRFFNFAYSIGAAIVIWGALFKILHLPGGNTLLSIGMGTEVLMFVLTAFDRPPREYNWEDVFPALRQHEEGEETDDAIAQINYGPAAGAYPGVPAAAPGAPVSAIPGIDLAESDARTLSESIAKMSAAAERLSEMAELTTATQQYLEQMSAIAADMQALHATTAALNEVSSTLLASYRAITENSAGITSASQGYVEQMQSLSHNLGGLNAIYELQLRSVSSQVESIDRVNRGIKDIRDMYEKSASQSVRYCEETEKMARYMQQLNSIYERMVQAMTVNMYRPMMNPADAGMPINGDSHHAPEQPQPSPSTTDVRF